MTWRVGRMPGHSPTECSTHAMSWEKWRRPCDEHAGADRGRHWGNRNSASVAHYTLRRERATHVMLAAASQKVLVNLCVAGTLRPKGLPDGGVLSTAGPRQTETVNPFTTDRGRCDYPGRSKSSLPSRDGVTPSAGPALMGGEADWSHDTGWPAIRG
jgi:hypothetical protein